VRYGPSFPVIILIGSVGYWFLENADESVAKNKKWSPPEGLVDFIDMAHEKGKKVVYMYVEGRISSSM
jgi:hypothetical protein